MTVAVTTTGLQDLETVAAALASAQWAIASGSSDTITAAYPVPNEALTDGLILGFRASAANTTTTPTFNPDGLGAATITKGGGIALAPGDIANAGFEALVRYSQPHSRWELMNPFVISGSGGSTGQVNVSGTHAVNAATENGKTLICSGNQYYAINFGATAGYANQFNVEIINADIYTGKGDGTQGRYKQIVLTGGPAFPLAPGDTVVVTNENGTWQCLPGGIANNVPAKKWQAATGGLICFVDPVLGSGNTDGLASGTGAFSTINAAIAFMDLMIDHGNRQDKIKLADGSYHESVTRNGLPVGSNLYFLEGNITNSNNVVINAPGANTTCFSVGDYGILIGAGFTVNANGQTGCFGWSLHQYAIVDAGLLDNGAVVQCIYAGFPGGTHISSDNFSKFNGQGPVLCTGGASVHCVMGPNAVFQQAGNVVYNMGSFLTFTTIFQGTGTAVLLFSPNISFGGSLSAGQQYALDGLTVLYLNSNTIPGTTGSVTHGALVI